MFWGDFLTAEPRKGMLNWRMLLEDIRHVPGLPHVHGTSPQIPTLNHPLRPLQPPQNGPAFLLFPLL
jgi:hypothetical protein